MTAHYVRPKTAYDLEYSTFRVCRSTTRASIDLEPIYSSQEWEVPELYW